MRINKLFIENFKGCRRFLFEPNGENATIFGDNETGKTTIMDAFLWLLTDKDSLNNAVFEIKPKGGESGVRTSVEACFDDCVLRKEYYEKWTKKRGSAEKEFTGNTTDYFIDGIPTKKKDFDKHIESIASAELFKMLTNPRYFNEHLHWEKRRSILLEMCGDVTDEDVINANPELKELPKILGDRSVDDYKKVVSAETKKINDELKMIPTRIDERQKSMIDIMPEKPRDRKTVDGIRATLAGDLKSKNEELLQIESGGRVSKLKQRLSETNAAIQDIKTKMAADRQVVVTEHNRKKNAAQKVLDDAEAALGKAIKDQKSKDELLTESEKTIEKIRANWYEEDAKQFKAPELDTVCPTCGQDIPTGQIEDAIEKAKAYFNICKADNLSIISDRGKDISKVISDITSELKAFEVVVENMKENVFIAKKSLKEISELPAEDPPPPELKDLNTRRLEIERDIEQAAAGNKDATDKLKSEIAEIESQIATIDAEIGVLKSIDESQARIQKLYERERELSGIYAELERHLFLIEKFIVAKVNLLEEKINSKFLISKFKMFDIQVNGGINDKVCELTVNDVPYWSVNNAARINAGIDVANVLSQYYQVSLPMFLDNAESVNEIMPSENQQIKLVVSHDKELKIAIGE
jgi:hypothetical protein